MGNTHAADHMYMVPVFIDGEHMFTACAKAHQADCGNSVPSTYHAYAKDVYEEGALIFPCVKVQENYRDVDDIIRMCRRRIKCQINGTVIIWRRLGQLELERDELKS